MTAFDFIEYLLNSFGPIVLAAVLMALIAYKLLEKFVHTKFDVRVTKLEHNFQATLAALNSYHAISKSSLEKAFHKKVKVYEKLLEKKNRRSWFINESPLADEPDSEEKHLAHVTSIIKIIDSNRLYITSDLAIKYDNWCEVSKPYLKASNDSEYEAWQTSFGTDSDREQAHYAGLSMKFQMMKETEREFQDILNCIDQDIRNIRSSLEYPTVLGLKTTSLSAPEQQNYPGGKA